MQVKHFLPGVSPVVDHQPVAALGDALFAGNLGCDNEHTPQRRFVFRGRVVDGGDGLIGDDQDVNGRLGVDVSESRHLVILVNDVGGDFAFDDFAENGFVGHNISPCCVLRIACYVLRVKKIRNTQYAIRNKLKVISMIPDTIIKEKISAKLLEIEAAENVKILYACESGSRAWGFASRDSDYDVRFIYVHPIEWYLAIDKRRDVIERAIDDDALDINGWNLQKALHLFRKSNPPLLEWLSSPIVYLEDAVFTPRFKALMPDYYSPVSCTYHYLQMARGNYREFLNNDTVWLKKYFYVLRPVLACKWIELDIGVVPMEFEKLLNRLFPEGPLRVEIDQLLELKRKGEELDRGPRISALNDFIEAELEGIEARVKNVKRSQPEVAPLNQLFRATLRDVWGKEYPDPSR